MSCVLCLIFFNKAFGPKIGNYTSADDVITVQLDMLVIDDPISVYQSQFTYQIMSDFNYGAVQLIKTGIITLTRSGNERPELSINATFVNDTTYAFESK